MWSCKKLLTYQQVKILIYLQLIKHFPSSLISTRACTKLYICNDYI